MKYAPKLPAVLVLADGTVFKGMAAGAVGVATGELCFNTGMTGYQEIFTDPSYTGQLMVMASVHIGNYGIKNSESESDGIKISGLICRNLSQIPSRKEADQSIQEFLATKNLVIITDVDTRAIVKHIREKGAMNAIISTANQNIDELTQMLKDVPPMEGLELSSKVSTQQIVDYNEGGDYKVALLDAGVKLNIVRLLADRACHVRVFPYPTTFDEIMQWEPDGFMLSNGPGDPGAMPETVGKVKAMLATNLPVFGICLGHQLLAEACGIRTFKMHNGHRGINHPVKNIITGRSEITSQNHGFAVMPEDVEKSDIVEVTHVNLNDNSIEGIRIKDKAAFSVQYHPEAAPGPHDSEYLFDDFVFNLKESIKNKVTA